MHKMEEVNFLQFEPRTIHSLTFGVSFVSLPAWG